MTNQRSSGLAAAPLLAVISSMNLSCGLWRRKRGQSPHDLFAAQPHLAVIRSRRSSQRFLLLSSCRGTVAAGRRRTL